MSMKTKVIEIMTVNTKLPFTVDFYGICSGKLVNRSDRPI